MGYLIAAGIVVLLFGLSLIFTSDFLKKLVDTTNKVIVYLDEKLQPVKLWVGLLLVVIAAWLLYVVANYPDLSYLTSVWVICLFFGLLFLFLPNWLSTLSNVSNKIIFSTDDVVMGSRKIIGIVLLIISIYIFYAAYAIR